jgi:2-(1,2-epoxy-1,2-dihydrophenyl)acetyl-CoA isomerase
MAESAFLQQPYTSNGLCIDGGGTYTLPRLLGLARALEIALFDHRIPAVTALQVGLVNRLVPDARLLEEAQEIARHAALRAFARAKRLMNAAHDTALEAQLEAERRELAAAANSREGREGLTAFVEKRRADFTTAAQPDEP